MSVNAELALQENHALQAIIMDRLRGIDFILSQITSTRVSSFFCNVDSGDECSISTPLDTWIVLGAERGKLLDGSPRWGRAATSLLLSEGRKRAILLHKRFDGVIWNSICDGLAAKGFSCYSSHNCFYHYVGHSTDKRIFNSVEDQTVQALYQNFGRAWWNIAEKLNILAVGPQRTPYQVAVRYEVLSRPVLYDSYLPIEVVWGRLAGLVPPHEVGVDCDRIATIAVASRKTGQLALSFSCIERALEYGQLSRLDEKGLYWRVFRILCRFSSPLLPLPAKGTREAAHRHEQFSLIDFTRILHTDPVSIQNRIRNHLLTRTRGLCFLDFEKASRQVFGHPRGAKVIFDEAQRLLTGL